MAGQQYEAHYSIIKLYIVSVTARTHEFSYMSLLLLLLLLHVYHDAVA